MKLEKYYSSTEVLGKYVDWHRIPDKILAQAIRRGNSVHTACGGYALGGYVAPLPLQYQGYFDSFKLWYDQFVERTIEVEKRYTCHLYKYTGQLDIISFLKSKRFALIDIKTPVTESKTWRIQLASYRHLLQSNDIEVDESMILQPKASGKIARAYKYDDWEMDFNIFIGALNAHRYIKS
jgi:hypothetical protein